MKYRDENGVFQDLYLPPTGDTLPIGTVVEYDGETVPYGYEEYGTDDYSTEETFTGKYFGDKKVYRKRFDFEIQMTTSATSISRTLSLTNVDVIFLDTTHSLFVETSTGQRYPIEYNNPPNNAATGYNIALSNHVPTFNFYKTANFAIWSLVLVVEYTKTTD